MSPVSFLRERSGSLVVSTSGESDDEGTKSNRSRSTSPVSAMREHRSKAKSGSDKHRPMSKTDRKCAGESFVDGKRYVNGARKEVRFSNKGNELYKLRCCRGITSFIRQTTVK